MTLLLPLQLKVIFNVPELERNNADSDEACVDAGCKGMENRDDNGHTLLRVPGTPSETFQRRKNRSKSPSGRNKSNNNMKHSASNASIDSVLGKNEVEDLSDSESESEWQDNNRGGTRL